MPASRRARAMIFAPRSWPSKPGLATTTRILRSTVSRIGASKCMRLARDVAEQRARDDESLDLARALVDLGDLGVAVVALGREVAHVAVAAEHLQRLARVVARHPRGEQLGLGALDRVRPPRLFEAR